MAPSRLRQGVLTALFLALSASACERTDRSVDGVPVSGDQGSATDPSTEVLAVLDRYLRAVESRDSATIRSLYVGDGRFVWIEDGMVRYRSADDVLEGLTAFPVEMPMRTTLTNPVVVRVGDNGAHAHTEFTTSIGEGGSGFSFGGVMSFFLESGPEGWRIVGGHVSSPRAR
ncbi:MAG: DUF3225 domain-containing protein [Gemmatimonadetes bacterium]|nr:DUF3225 domain-containing protein [Gemmatimonadota bacterium]